MGYIDSDTHVIETAATWDHMDPGEERLKPMIMGDRWVVEDLEMSWPPPMTRKWQDVVFAGTDLVDVPARLEHMDDFGVDVQVLFPTWWLLYPVVSPAQEAAMYRSYNRWMAEGTADSGGRLRWAALCPVRSMDRAYEDMEFAKEHGAVSVFLLGQTHGLSLADPTMSPLYAKAQDLDLAISVHVGGDLRNSRRQPGNALHANMMTTPGAFFALLWGRVMDKFPDLRWSFLEAGASWVPYVLRETFRADATGAFRSFRDWHETAMEVIEGRHFHIACQIDDDIPYLTELLGRDVLIHGTDYGHLDLGADPDGLHVISNELGLEAEVSRKIVDRNARTAFGIDPSFNPAPAPTVFDLPDELVAQGLPVLAEQ
jgi:predicted TIM-barrel fold metal-dependent hydrolase